MKRPLIGLAICVVCFLLSIPFCGAAGNVQNAGRSDLLVGTGLILLGISIVGGLASLIWLFVAAIRGK